VFERLISCCVVCELFYGLVYLGYFSKQLKSECEKQFRVRSLATISDNVSSVSDTSVPQTDVKRDSTCQVHDRSLPSPSDLMVKLKVIFLFVIHSVPSITVYDETRLYRNLSGHHLGEFLERSLGSACLWFLF
jgi:hypothetical protein